MKNSLTLFGLAAMAAILFPTFAFSQTGDKKEVTKDIRHIKMVKIIDGKKMTLDTVITGNAVLVWQGDTINPAKHNSEFSSSGVDQMHRYDVTVDDKGGRKNVMIYRQKIDKDNEPMIWQIETDDADQDLNLTDGDSISKKIIIRKRMRDGDENRAYYFGGPDRNHFPPMPPVPPVPHFRMQQQGQVIDLNDPDIISYKKKNLSGGREKIEIIRKKSDKNKDMTFEFRDGDLSPVPEAPGMPNKPGDVQHMKITEKKTKVDGKDGKQIEVKVESEENK